MVEPDDFGWPEDTVEPFTPCPKCQSLNRWQDFRGRWRCVTCEGDAGRRALAKAGELMTEAARMREVADRMVSKSSKSKKGKSRAA